MKFLYNYCCCASLLTYLYRKEDGKQVTYRPVSILATSWHSGGKPDNFGGYQNYGSPPKSRAYRC